MFFSAALSSLGKGLSLNTELTDAVTLTGPQAPERLSVSQLPRLELPACTTMPGFHMIARD